MLKLNASSFTRTIAIFREIQAYIEFQAPRAGSIVGKDNRERIDGLLNELIDVVVTIGMPLTVKSIGRLKGGLERENFTFIELKEVCQEIESRAHDELDLVSIFRLDKRVAEYYDPSLPLFGVDVANKFPSANYEIDEAGKCLALRRSTACVFHLMRVMEISIRAIADCLSIPPPTKDVERNWGRILQAIKAQLDNRAKSGWPDVSDKELFTRLYASLDAVRLAWRNPTMHVEAKYLEDEAEYIFGTVRGFMKIVASRMDVQGQPLA